MEEIAEVATRIIVLDDAEVFADGDVAEIFARTRELQGIGLDIPEITKYMQEKGFENVWTVAQAEEILRNNEQRTTNNCG